MRTYTSTNVMSAVDLSHITTTYIQTEWAWMSTKIAVTYAKEMDTMIEMNYRNAVVGKVIEVSQRPWDSTNRRQVAIECCDPFKFTTTLVWVHNYEDAMMMVDRMVCVYDGELYPLEVGGE